MPLKVEQGWSIADSESKNALYWEFFKVISTPQGNKALCILCNNCVPVGASASELKRHLETESKKSVFSSKETEKERILATVHALAWRVCCKASAAEGQSTGSAGGPSIQTKAEIEWRMDVGNAVWVCTDKKSLRTLFTDAFRERERTVSCQSGACVPTTRYRLEQTIVSLYAAVKRRIFRILERSREYFGKTPHLHLSADGWSPRSGAVLVHTCLSVLVPIGEQKVTTFERLNISLGARLCEFGEFQSISSDVLSKFLVAVLKEYGVQVPKADDVFDSHILSSTTDVGSNFGAANTMLKLEALPCLAHVLCNAVQWSLGLKAAQSKNPCAREFLVAMRDFTKGIRKRKVEAALKNWCTRNSRKLSKVTMYNDTRWNSSFLTMLQLLWLEEPLRRAFIGPATRNDFGTTQKEKSANKALADNWLDVGGFEAMKGLLPVLSLAYRATQAMQGPHRGTVDGFLALLHLRQSLLRLIPELPTQASDLESEVFTNLMMDSQPIGPMVFSGFLNTYEAQSVSDNLSRFRKINKQNILGEEPSQDEIQKLSQYLSSACAEKEYVKIQNRWCRFRYLTRMENEASDKNTKLRRAVTVKILEQVDKRFFGNSLASSRAFKTLHDGLGLLWRNPRDTTCLNNPFVMATILMDPYVATLLYRTDFFKAIGLDVAGFSPKFEEAVTLLKKLVLQSETPKTENDDDEVQAWTPGAKGAGNPGLWPSTGSVTNSYYRILEKACNKRQRIGARKLDPSTSCIKKYLEWLERVRDFDQNGEPHRDFHSLAEMFCNNPHDSTKRMISFWSSEKAIQFGTLAKVGLALANTACTSAEVERHASSSGLIDVPKRHALRKTYFEMLEFLADNQNLLFQVKPEMEKDRMGHKLSQTKAKAILKAGCAAVRHTGLRLNNVQDAINMDEDEEMDAAQKVAEADHAPVETLLEEAQLINDESDNEDHYVQAGFSSWGGLFNIFDKQFDEAAEKESVDFTHTP